VTASSSSSASALPELPHIPASALASLRPPRPRIHTDRALHHWPSTPSYAYLQIYLTRLTSACIDVPLHSPLLSSPSGSVQALFAFLDAIDAIVDRTPPLPTPQRYGNLAFRTFGEQLALSLPQLLPQLLPDDLHPAEPFLTPHLLSSFGNFTRMDYGTGHELSFLLFLLSLSLLHFLPPMPSEERQLALLVFPHYIRLCWKLQDQYHLEPAGSHGVWGLDDYHFLPYLFGSAQLLHSPLPPSYILHLPSPRSPPENLYEQLIQRVLSLKSGPFSEHSPQLYSIAASVHSWSKVASGLRKMYDAEVLGKRVVVQHLALGGLLEWD
ncbi:Phosphotyrosyl phosphatase activator, partial [Calocera viscosa TUFC12733]